jgi:hypothetical protein
MARLCERAGRVTAQQNGGFRRGQYFGQALTFPVLFVDWGGRRLYDHRFVAVAALDIVGDISRGP